MSKQKKIAIFDASWPLESFYKQAKQLGYEIHSFDMDSNALCKKYSDKFYPISFTETDEIVKICNENDIKGVISFTTEIAQPWVNAAARKLGSPSNSIECEKLMENKFTMRERLNECGVSIPEYQIVEDLSFNSDLNFPVIVKPTDNGGSRGVTRVDRKEDLKPAIEWAMQFARNKKVIIERFVEGREFSVEYISHNGKHYFIAITDKVTTGSPHFVELEHHQPTNVSDETIERIKKLTEDTLTALKVSNSVTHTEIKMEDNGDIFIIETSPRMGGDFITSDLVKLSTGYDLVNGAIELAIGEFTPPLFPQQQYSGIYFLAKGREYVEEYIVNKDEYPFAVEAERYDGPIIEVKQNNDRAGHFIYQNNNERLIIKKQ